MNLHLHINHTKCSEELTQWGTAAGRWDTCELLQQICCALPPRPKTRLLRAPHVFQLKWRWFNRWLILSGAFANKQLLNVMDEMERQKYPKYIEEGKLTSWKYIATCVANQSYLILLQITFRINWDCGWINILYNQTSKQLNKQSVSIICRKDITNRWYILAYWPVFKSLPS